jgi:Protein of unknown function (DUF3071)
MRQLRFVTLSEDGGHALVETPDGTEQYALEVDARLRDAVGADLPRLPVRHRPEPVAAAGTDPSQATPSQPAPSQPAPSQPTAAGRTPGAAVDAIGPRDIQVRVRAGESPEELAAATGMSLERVLRFAAPVVEERLRIADEARRARARRTSIEGVEHKVVIFGEAVDERFAAHGIDVDSVTWNARRRDDGEWLVVASWTGGESTHTAEWLFSRSTRSVTPMDDTAADLLSDRPIRPVAPPAPERLSLAAAPALAPGVVAFPPMPDAHTGPVPVLEEVFDQEAPPEGPRPLPPLVPAAATLDYDAPPLPLGITDPATRPAAAHGVGALRNLGVTRRDESDEERAARARVPSWDDILLGIRRKED